MSKSVWISIALAAVASLWILSGAIFGANQEQKEKQDQAHTQAFKVKVARAKATEMTREVILQGEITAGKDIEIRAETSGIIETLLAKKGQSLNKGSPIATIAVNDRAAKLAEAKAQLRVAQADLAANKRLKTKRLISDNQYERSLASVSAAEANVRQMEVELGNTNINAAFAGRLNTLNIEQGDYVDRGDHIGSLIDPKTIKISATIPQQDVFHAKVGQAVVAELLDGSQIEGKVSYISSTAEPITRAFRMEAIAALESEILHIGLSARIKLQIETRLAHKFPVSYLDLDKSQKLQIKGVTENNQVSAYPVTIIQHTNDGVWLSGLPESFTVITQGQGFVEEGDTVEPVSSSSTKDSTNTEQPAGQPAREGAA